jgi:hypothetical protein
MREEGKNIPQRFSVIIFINNILIRYAFMCALLPPQAIYWIFYAHASHETLVSTYMPANMFTRTHTQYGSPLWDLQII